MDTTITKSGPPSLRRWRRRLLYLVILLVLAVAGWFALPWILMPADLRAMQGHWKIVEYVKGPIHASPPPEVHGYAFEGNQLMQISHEGEKTPPERIDIDPHTHEIVVLREQHVNILGFRITPPLWWRRSPERKRLPYEWKGEQLLITLNPDNPDPFRVVLERQ